MSLDGISQAYTGFNVTATLKNRGAKSSGITFELKAAFEQLERKGILKDKNGDGLTSSEASNMFAKLNEIHKSNNMSTDYGNMNAGQEFTYSASDLWALAEAAGYEVVQGTAGEQKEVEAGAQKPQTTEQAADGNEGSAAAADNAAEDVLTSVNATDDPQVKKDFPEGLPEGVTPCYRMIDGERTVMYQVDGQTMSADQVKALAQKPSAPAIQNNEEVNARTPRLQATGTESIETEFYPNNYTSETTKVENGTIQELKDPDGNIVLRREIVNDTANDYSKDGELIQSYSKKQAPGLNYLSGRHETTGSLTYPDYVAKSMGKPDDFSTMPQSNSGTTTETVSEKTSAKETSSVTAQEVDPEMEKAMNEAIAEKFPQGLPEGVQVGYIAGGDGAPPEVIFEKNGIRLDDSEIKELSNGQSKSETTAQKPAKNNSEVKSEQKTYDEYTPQERKALRTQAESDKVKQYFPDGKLPDNVGVTSTMGADGSINVQFYDKSAGGGQIFEWDLPNYVN